MSHFTSLELQISDRDSLIAGLQAIGFKDIEIHANGSLMNTYWKSMNEPTTANVIVRCPNNQGSIGRSDVGFVLVDGKYQMICDEYELRKGMTWSSQKEFTTAVKIEYGVAVATKAAIAKGMQVTRERTNDGRVQLKMIPQKQVVRR